MCDNISHRIDRVLHVGQVDLVTRVSDVVFDRREFDRQGPVVGCALPPGRYSCVSGGSYLRHRLQAGRIVLVFAST